MNEQYTNMMDVIKGDYRIAVVLGSYGNSFDYRKLSIGTNLAEKFKHLVSTYIARSTMAVDMGFKELIQYKPGYKKESEQIQFLAIENDECESLKHAIDSMPSIKNMHHYNEKDTDFINNMSFYCFIIQSKNGHTIRLYRKFANVKGMVKSNGIKAIWSEGVYDDFEEKVLNFDEKIDCVYFNNYIFVENTHYFQTIFRYYDGLRKNARKVVSKISDKIPISNHEEFAQLCLNHTSMLTKVNNISSQSYFESITMNDIKRTIDKFEVNVDIVTENGVEKLLFNKSNKWGILHLLGDDYLGSMMTDNLYVSNSKSAVK